MAIKSILLTDTEMDCGILDGRKSCIRRFVKFLPGENPQWTGYIKDGLMLYNGRNEPCIRKVPYQPGDILYVRETWHKYIKRVGEGEKGVIWQNFMVIKRALQIQKMRVKRGNHRHPCRKKLHVFGLKL